MFEPSVCPERLQLEFNRVEWLGANHLVSNMG